jgi:hypothetical protein
MALARIDGSVLDNVPRPVPGAQIAVLTQPANTTTQPGSPLASIFSDVNGAFPLANPFSADGTGNYFFYIAAGTYTIQIYGGTLAAQIVLADQAAGTPAAGVSLQHNGTNNSTQTLLNIAQGSNVTVSEAAGTVTIAASAAAVTFQTNTVNNSSQTTLNLVQGSGITLTNTSGGNVTIAAAAGATFQTNGVNNSSQSTLNLQNGTNITITNPSAGNVSFAVAWPVFQTNSTPNSTQSPLNFISGNNIQASNPSAGQVRFDAFGTIIKSASVDLTAQSAAIATTTLLAVGSSGAGQYLLCWNAKVTTAATTSCQLGALTITYTDPDSTVQTITAAAVIPAGTIATNSTTNTTANVLIGVPLTINAANSTNIQYAFAYTSVGGTAMQYNLHLRLEALPT